MAKEDDDLDVNADRGDDFTPTDDTAAAAAAEQAAKEAEDKRVEQEILDKAGEKKDEAKDDKAKGDEAKGDEAKDDKEEQLRDEQGKFTSKSIPKARVDEMVTKERARAEAAERRLAELEAQQKQAASLEEIENQITALEKEHAQATLDGKADRMAELAAEIRKLERTVQNSTVSNASTATAAQLREEIRLDVAIEQAQEAYPQLVEGHTDYDQDIVDMILNSQTVYMSRDGMSAAEALTTAVNKIMGKLTPPLTEPEKKGLDAAKKDTDDRKAKQVDKNIDAANKQPASMKDVGADSDKKGVTGVVDVSRLTMEEFDALPETKKAELRGDTL